MEAARTGNTQDFLKYYPLHKQETSKGKDLEHDLHFKKKMLKMNQKNGAFDVCRLNGPATE